MSLVSGPLIDEEQAKTFWTRYVWPRIQPALAAGQRLHLVVREATRTLKQNSKFHALCGDLAKSGHEFAGKKRSAKQWKVLLVSGHAHHTGEEVDIVPGLEGEFVNLRESTALMSVSRCSSLIEYTVAWMVVNGIPIIDGKDTE